MAPVPIAVVVDGYSTGNLLPPAFTDLGAEVVHVQSTAELVPTMDPPDLQAYRANVINPELDPGPLAQYRPVAVVAGSEYGVCGADLLAERLGVPGNPTALSTARRDKYRMIETLRSAGIRCARQFSSAKPAEIRAWARDNGYPVVVKPHRAASTQNVVVCYDDTAVTRAAEEVLASVTMFGERNSAVLVQSFLAGTEYIVDTVSSAGRRYVCGVWRYEKSITPAGRPLYDRDVLADPDSPEVAEMVSYLDEVLAALGVEHGPAHSEVIMTPDGPALVELAARLNGNMNPHFHDRCIGGNQAALTALAAVRPEEFRRGHGGGVYRKRFDACVHNAQTTLSGLVTGIDEAVLDKISALPTVLTAVPRLRPGRRLRPTVDLLTSPLRVFMVGSDPAALRADHDTINGLVDRLYTLDTLAEELP